MTTGCAQFGVSGIVLAGGQSRRLGRDKAVEPIGGLPLIRRVIDRIAQVTDEVVVVIADQARRKALPLDDEQTTSVDRYPGCGSLGGIFSGLTEAEQPWGITVACDMPFLNVALLRHMMELRENVDAVVPIVEGRPEPTHALYSKVCLPAMEQRLQSRDLKISGFFEQVRVRYIPEEEVASLDPDFLSFFNINTPDDLDRARDLIDKGE
jgi:molybdopterin-guanine dinucleotide biosynthesis protein A